MAKVKQQQKQSSKNSKCCCNSIRFFIKFLSGKHKNYTIIQELDKEATVKPIPIIIENQKKEFTSSPKRECKQYHFEGEVILVANDNLRFQEWLKLVESSK
jgi:hypothetical protein